MNLHSEFYVIKRMLTDECYSPIIFYNHAEVERIYTIYQILFLTQYDFVNNEHPISNAFF